MHSHRKLGFFTATALVIANMIGTGIFTTTGFLIADLKSPTVILFVWLLGGLLALSGALVYGELGAAMPRSGGEYHYLSKIYHPLIGFLSGWVSLIVGFSAPIAASAVAFGKYLSTIYPEIPVIYAALTLVILLSMIHIMDVKLGGYTQNAFTLLKVILILTFIAAGAWYFMDKHISVDVHWGDIGSVFEPSFAVALIFVYFAYSGWNAATYIGGEIEQPEKNLPRSLIIGTSVVILLYLGLNLIFLYGVTPETLAGKVEVGHVVAGKLFGTSKANLQ